MKKIKKIIVGISPIPPFVIENNKKYTGFEIDLWEKIADKLSLEFIYKRLSFSDLLPALKNKKIDMALAGITRTKDREEMIDFSHFTINTGLLTLINKKSKRSILSIFKNIYKKILIALILLFSYVLIFSHVIWWLEKDAGVYNASYWLGIKQSVWYTVLTISTVGLSEFNPITNWGKLFVVITVLIGLVIFSLLVAELASALTMMKMKYKINSYKDLKDKTVATKEETVSVDELNKIGANVVVVPEIDDAYKLLEKNMVEAVVFDAAPIQYFLKKQIEERFVAVGGIFAQQTYGIAFQEKSPIKELINREILNLMESGEYEALYKKWLIEI